MLFKYPPLQSYHTLRLLLHAQTVTANFLMGKLFALVFWRCVLAWSCSVFRARRKARVFLGRKSKGVYFLPAYCLRASAFCFWLYTVRTRAMFLRTTLIFMSLEAAPPATFATRSWESSLF